MKHEAAQEDTVMELTF